MRNNYLVLPNTQRGATLLLALLILIMIMMHGIPTVMNNTLNERMSGNTRNRDLAFQAAEHALKDAESIFSSGQTTNALNASFDPNSDGNCSDHVTGYHCDGESHLNDATYWRNTFDWYSDDDDTICSHLSPPNLTEPLYAQPCYIVEKMTEACLEDPLVDACDAGQKRYYYRVTARGVGKERNAIVILQTMYEFTE